MPKPLNQSKVRLFAGSSNRPLATSIAQYLGIPLTPTKISRFSNDNLYIQLGATVRSRKVYIVQSLSPPVNDHLMELFMMLDIARSAAAREVHAIIPYFSFARSDKKDAPRISITARLIADMLQAAGATQVMTMTLHSPQVHGFFSIPADPLSARPAFLRHYLDKDISNTNTIVVAPDIGQAKSAHRFAKDLGLSVAAGLKERLSDTEVRLSGLIGHDVSQCHRAIIYDDEIATGGTVREMARFLIERGVQEISVACTHGVFTTGTVEKLVAIPQVSEIVCTDTIYIPPEQRHPKLQMLSVAHLFGDAIYRNYRRMSIGDLFVFGDEDDPDHDEDSFYDDDEA